MIIKNKYLDTAFFWLEDVEVAFKWFVVTVLGVDRNSKRDVAAMVDKQHVPGKPDKLLTVLEDIVHELELLHAESLRHLHVVLDHCSP
jgi:hypothetical protein